MSNQVNREKLNLSSLWSHSLFPNDTKGPAYDMFVCELCLERAEYQQVLIFV